jgi:hypothetical protein
MEKAMTRRVHNHRVLCGSLLAGALIVGLASVTAAQDDSQQPSQQQQQQPQQQQRMFSSPEDGVAALVDALRKDDKSGLEAVLGPGSPDIIESGDAVADKNEKDAFLKDYDAKNTLVPVNDMTRTLEVGQSDWPLPIPIVKRGANWSFDLEAGRDELLSRRIGRNEDSTIKAMLAVVDAEREYASVDHNGDGILEYAPKFASTPGMMDGLYWPVQPGQEQSPLGPLFAQAQAEGYFQSPNGPADPSAGAPSGPQPYHGYYYMILTAQGQSAPGGAYDYIVDGKMIGGFALIAYPAEYGDSGVMTFIVNHDGVVYQRDLGPDTEDIALTASEFEPDDMWRRVPTPVGVASTP